MDLPDLLKAKNNIVFCDFFILSYFANCPLLPQTTKMEKWNESEHEKAPFKSLNPSTGAKNLPKLEIPQSKDINHYSKCIM